MSGVLTVSATWTSVPGGLATLHEDAHRLGLRLTSTLHPTGEYEVTLQRVDKYDTAEDDLLAAELDEMAAALPGGPVERTTRWSLPGELPF